MLKSFSIYAQTVKGLIFPVIIDILKQVDSRQWFNVWDVFRFHEYLTSKHRLIEIEFIAISMFSLFVCKCVSFWSFIYSFPVFIRKEQKSCDLNEPRLFYYMHRIAHTYFATHCFSMAISSSMAGSSRMDFRFLWQELYLMLVFYSI